MRLIKISVGSFQCIESAELELGPGLNILYGPNDHGKSTLATAIRAGLLLQHNSTTREKLVSWHTGDAPNVTLSFATPDGRFWRVRKVFSKTGSSTLESSKDGKVFSKDGDARQVDDKLRQLLGWGIPKPGGASNVKGLPESFLTTVLLAEQADVPGILARGLETDKEESGRTRLNHALQALAQEPLFKKVLDRAKSQVSKAYTAAGKLTRKEGSPLQLISAQIAELRGQQDELQRQINETETAEAVLANLHEQVVQLGLLAAQRNEELAQASQGWKIAQAQERLMVDLAGARQKLDAAQAELEALVQQTASLAESRQSLKVQDDERGRMQEREVAAAQALERAKQRLQEATSDTGAQERELRLQQLKTERLQSEQQVAQLQSKLAEAQAAAALAEEARQSTRALEVLREQIRALQESVTRLAGEEQQAGEREALLKRIKDYAALKEARDRCAEAESSLAQTKLLAQQAEDLRGQATELETGVTALSLPGREEVSTLEKLHRELEKAEDRLGGGLSISLQPRRDLNVRVAVDGQREQERSGSERFELEARRTVTLVVDDLFEATITAGEADARQKVEQLRQRWADAGQPTLQRTGSTDIAALMKARDQADTSLRSAQQLREQAVTAEKGAQEHAQRAERVEELRERVRQRSQEMAGCAESELASELAGLGTAWESEVTRQSNAAESARKTVAAQRQESQQRLTGLQGRLDGEEAAHAKLSQRAQQAMVPYPEGTAELLAIGPGQLSKLQAEAADKEQQLSILADQAGVEVDEAQKAVASAAETMETTSAQRTTLEQRLAELGQEIARADGVLEQRQKQAQALDLEAARGAVAALEAELAKLPPGQVSESDVAAAQKAVEIAQQNYQDKEGEINVARGRLTVVSGDVAREQKRDLDGALVRAEEREHEITVEYGAWKLLADTLREVENTHGAHLGKALSGPVSLRLAELCAGRYGELTIDPHLKSEGLSAAGKMRPFESLSEGTKDQIATLFRLGIAEHLGSAIILDDHLNQSDPAKVQWFLEQLRRTSEKIQVILITCRPGDYLSEEERPEPDQLFLDGPRARMRAVNLAQAIRRYSK